MMCRKCGQSIPRDADRCPNCGAPAPARRPERRSVSRAANPKLAAKIPFMLMGLALLHLVEIGTWFIPAIRMDTEGVLSGRLSLFKLLGTFSGAGSLGTLFILLDAAMLIAVLCAVYLALMPVFRGGNGRRMRMVTSKVTVLAHAAILLGLYGIYSSIGKDEGYAAVLLPGGVLQLVLCAGILVLTMVISYASRQKKVDRI